MEYHLNHIPIKIHYPLLIVLMGSVFVCSFCRIETMDFLRLYWTVGGLYVLTTADCIRFIHAGNRNASSLSIKSVLWTIYITGLAEAIFVTLQLMDIFPSRPVIYVFTGSFANPSIASMLFSVAIPIGLYFTNEIRKKRIRYIVLFTSLYMFSLVLVCVCRTGILAVLISSFIVLFTCNNNIHRIISRKYLYIGLALFSMVMLYVMYLVKPDSVNGRTLIWTVAMDMISDRPWLGYGSDGFNASYMTCQAKYFRDNPDSPFSLLADNACSLYNEFLHITIICGIAGLFTFLIILYVVFLLIRKSPQRYRKILYGLYSTILIWSVTYFPFNVPFVWVLCVSLIIAMVVASEIGYKMKGLLYISFVTIFSLYLFLNIKTIYYKVQWHIIQGKSLKGETVQMLPSYSKLYNHLKGDMDFLYNYGAELHYVGKYTESLKILNECSVIYNDYNVQMLIADDYAKLGYADSAIVNFRFASDMIPNRFLPLYHIMQIHISRDDYIHAKEIAREILNKPVKIKNSKSVERIREDAYSLLRE